MGTGQVAEVTSRTNHAGAISEIHQAVHRCWNGLLSRTKVDTKNVKKRQKTSKNVKKRQKTSKAVQIARNGAQPAQGGRGGGEGLRQWAGRLRRPARPDDLRPASGPGLRPGLANHTGTTDATQNFASVTPPRCRIWRPAEPERSLAGKAQTHAQPNAQTAHSGMGTLLRILRL